MEDERPSGGRCGSRALVCSRARLTLDPTDAVRPDFPTGFLEALPALLEGSGMALVALDAGGTIRRWSAGAESLLGFAAGDVVGRPAAALFPGLAPDPSVIPAGADGPRPSERTIPLAAQSGQPVACGVRRLAAPDGGSLLLLTDRRGETETLHALRCARTLAGLLGGDTWVLDAGGRIRELSDAARARHGRDEGKDAWVGRHVADLVGGDRRDILAGLRHAAREGRWQGTVPAGDARVPLELAAVRDDAGALLGFVGASPPAAGGECPQLFREAPLAMLLLDGALRVLEVNREMAALSGALPADPAGLDARSLALFQNRDVQAALDALIAGYDFDLPEVRLAGTAERPGALVRLQGRRLAGVAGAGFLVALVPRDANSDVERQLLRAQKMESIGNFASGLAHDFGNFVAVILGKAGVLRVKLPEDPHITRDLDDIETAAKRAQHLAQELMKFARGGRNRVARLDVNRLLEEVGALIRTSVGKRITLDVRLEDGLPPIDGDEVELQQLVLNLCLNARDAMPNGGRLIVETRPLTDAQARRLAGDGSVASGVSIVVRDTGSGMPPDVLERIFEPFFTTKHEGNKGAGLGLAMVYGIVRRHGGAIDVKSRPGMGTAFEILLPAAGAGVGIGDGKYTLVVDDEPAFGEMIRLILEEDGVQVKLAANGIEALRIIREELQSLSVVILDLRMPGVDGLAVLEELRELAPQLPVLVTTGYAGPEEKQQALARGARRVLEKPYRVADLRQALQEVLAGGAPTTP